MLARGFVLLWLASGLLARPADACLNSTRIKKSEAVKLVAAAEKYLAAGEYLRVFATIGDGCRLGFETADAALERNARVTLNTALSRAGDTRCNARARLKDLAAEDERPLTKARWAEAAATFGDTDERAEGAKVLEDLATRDLLAEPEAWAALSRARAASGDEEGAAQAATRCRKLTKRKGVCPAAAP